VAEGARLESVYTGNRIVGSNPTPSARLPSSDQFRVERFLVRRRLIASIFVSVDQTICYIFR
jgi:hypothetical protein